MADDLKTLIDKSPFSFVGTVLHLGAAMSADLPITETTAVVRVDHVLHAPDAFANYDGHQVTLEPSSDQPALSVGDQFAFFVEGVAFGEALSVREIGRLPVADVEPHAQAAMAGGVPASAFKDVIHELHLGKLKARMESADAVVVAKVVGIEKVGPVRHSEHDPDWWRATLEIRHVERGSVSGDTVQVLYANSTDVHWRDRPKPQASQGGLWILHAVKDERREWAPYELVSPYDVQPTQQLDVIR
jgi:hypothetical protein